MDIRNDASIWNSWRQVLITNSGLGLGRLVMWPSGLAARRVGAFAIIPARAG